MASAPAPAHALVFQFQFDNVGDGPPLDPPIVGSGSFSFDGDPGAGSFALTSLPNYTFSFLFDGGNSFGNADIATPLNEVLVLISQTGNTYDLKFSNIGPTGGPFGGSIDFDNTVSTLSFEPPGFGNLDLYIFSSTASFYYGNYSATAPVPSATASVPGPLPIFGVAAAFGFSRRLRRRINLAKSSVGTDSVAVEQL